MAIDTAQKISDIVFKGIIATAASVVAIYMTWQKNNGDLIKQCDSFYSTLIDTAAVTKFDENAKQRLIFRIDNYNKMCASLSDAQIQNVLNLMIQPAAVEPQQPAGNSGLMGWVALSRIPANQYADTNFDGAIEAGSFAVGNVVKARWGVNVRLKNTPVSAGDNPVLGVIEGGTCVKIEERATGQLNEWARISQHECSRT